MYKSEQELMEELVESIYSGNVESTSDDEKEEKTDEAEENEDSTEEKDEEESEESEDEGEEESDEEEESEDCGSDDDDDDKGGGEGGEKSGPFTSKIRTLQKQYNDLLIDAFEKYAPECIEDALDETKSAFGENIEDILVSALDKLKSKIMGDLGVEGSMEDGMGMPPAAMGSFDPLAGAGKPMEISLENGE